MSCLVDLSCTARAGSRTGVATRGSQSGTEGGSEMNRTSLLRGRRSCARVASPVERLEGRVLLAANAWKSAVSGNWTDATRWSLGHVPTATEDVSITVAGSYTVTAPGPAGTQLAA